MTLLESIFKGQWPEALLFDLDGTLVDSAPDIALAADQMRLEFGMEAAGLEKVSGWVGNGAAMLIRRALVDNHKGNAEEFFSTQQIARAESVFFAAYEKCNGKKSCLYAGVVDFLKEGARENIPMAIITNKPERFVGPLLARLDIADYFKVIVAGDTLEVKKPAPQPVLFACEQLKVPVALTLMVGDSRNDVLAALAAGSRIACVDYGYNQGVALLDDPLDWYGSNLLALLK